MSVSDKILSRLVDCGELLVLVAGVLGTRPLSIQATTEIRTDTALQGLDLTNIVLLIHEK
jgi:hypothetical protein